MAFERFDEYQARCLYDPIDGFYSKGGRAGGARGDFLTSPEVGPLFGVVIARFLDARWADLGRPAEFDVVEVGAGRGALAQAVLTSEADCADALRYTCVEQSLLLRAEAADLLGDRVEVRAELPVAVTGVIVANELIDNIPVRIVEKTDTEWAELWVDGSDEELRPVEIPVGESLPVGTRLPVFDAAYTWVKSALGRLEAGSLLLMDYGVADSADLVGRPWLRTYARHGVGTDPLAADGDLGPGDYDITVDVAFDQLPPPTSLTSQSEFLRRHGILELVEEGVAEWKARKSVADLAAVRFRSRITEAEALLEPAGLGGFLVAEYRVG